ncbi:MAG: hypothetical protein AAGG50_17380 [Bacteroidota bacterium]
MTALYVNPLTPLRWAAVIPAAMLATVAAQVAFTFLGGLTLASLFTSGPDSIIWASKTVASPFMGAAFVAAATWAAPSRRRTVAVVATILVVCWGLALAVGAGAWGLAIGALGVVGALAALAIIRQAAA